MLTDTKVFGGGFKQRILDDLGLTLGERGWGWFLTGLALSGLVIEAESVW